MNSNATASAFNQTQDYFGVLEEVSKYNVHLNYFERLWAVCSPPLSPTPRVAPPRFASSTRNARAAMGYTRD